MKKKVLRFTGFLLLVISIAVMGYFFGHRQGRDDGFAQAKSQEDSRKYAEGYRKGRSIAIFKDIEKLYSLMDILKIKNLPSVNYDEIFSRQHILNQSVETFDDFYRLARQRFKEHLPMLQKRWGIPDSQHIEAIFYMNLVSGLWGFGNAREKEKVGCVRSNENNDWQEIPGEQFTIKTYLQSQIACCSDSANLLSYLLQRAGIEQMIIAFPGHVLNEARLGGRWYTLDAFSNIMFHASWSEIRQPGRKISEIVVTLFPHHDLLSGDNPHYRENIGHFRITLLLSAVFGVTGKVSYPTLPDYFQ